MIIETTINLDYEIAAKLDKAATITRKTRSDLFILLMKRVMKEHQLLLRNNRRVEYQKKLNEGNWTCLHVKLLIRDYEFCLDMRKFCKRSVSMLFAYAVSCFLEEILLEIAMCDDKLQTYDNNQFLHYILLKETIDNVICWRIYWGLPYNLEKIYPYR